MKFRFWEIDMLRGVAIAMMLLSNFVTDLDYFGILSIQDNDFWFYFARLTAAFFILLAGISLVLSYERSGKAEGFGKYLKRGVKIFSWGLVITAVTWIFLGDKYIIFGILHFMGLSIILAYPFLRHKYAPLVSSVFFISLGIVLMYYTFESPWLIWLGLVPQNFESVDYVPIFPWFGVFLMGISLGNSLYENYRRTFFLADLSSLPLVKILCLLGKNSLKIYLVHQPVFIAVILLLIKL